MSDPITSGGAPPPLVVHGEPVAWVRAYHEGTKHHFNRFARSLGYLDWASQPTPFRSFAGAPRVPLYPAPGAEALERPPSPAYDQVFGTELPAHAIALPALGFVLRHALGLSAWKVFRGSRWSLRVNPSSGNLHPTEAYVITSDRTWHYMPDLHAFEERCRFRPDAWRAWLGDAAGPEQEALVVLTSIHWREAWKYGERAFRYCQHDIGHAIAALRLAAAMCGWRATIQDDWSHARLSAVTGIDRDDDYVDAEREEPACALLLQANGGVPAPGVTPAAIGGRASTVALDRFVDAVRQGTWSGSASQLSEDHVQWTFIDEVATATRVETSASVAGRPPADRAWPDTVAVGHADREVPRPDRAAATTLMLQRRSAVAFDGRTSMSRQAFFRILARVMPGPHAPWDALWWAPRIHLVLFVHRVDRLDPGLYLLPRSEQGEALLRRALTREFAWEPAGDADDRDGESNADRRAPRVPLLRLASGDCRRLAQRLSCDQDIAADGCFSLGMLADYEGALREHGAPFYRRLFWESGVIGQVLYLEAEQAGVRGTGIGCFFDDGVHEALGIVDASVQSLYHFTVGGPVEDSRLTTETGYRWG